MSDTPDTNKPPIEAATLTQDQIDALQKATNDQLKEVPNVATPEIGEKVLLSAVYGRILHPEVMGKDGKNPQAFDTGEITSVVFDWWHKIQFEAGKLVHAVL